MNYCLKIPKRCVQKQRKNIWINSNILFDIFTSLRRRTYRGLYNTFLHPKKLHCLFLRKRTKLRPLHGSFTSSAPRNWLPIYLNQDKLKKIGNSFTRTFRFRQLFMNTLGIDPSVRSCHVALSFHTAYCRAWSVAGSRRTELFAQHASP